MKKGILLKVLVAIVLGIAVGWLTGPDLPIFGVPILKYYTLIGQLFLNALTLVVIPLVLSSIISGTAKMGREKSFKTLGAKTFGFYILTSAIAVLIGLGAVLLFQPGVSETFTLPNASVTDALVKAAQTDGFDKIADILYKLIPQNIFAAATQGQMLGLILFSILFGYFVSQIESHASSVLLSFWQGVFQVMMAITHLVMLALPIGVFGLIAKVAATTGASAVGSVAWFFVAVLTALLVYGLVALPLLLLSVGKVNPMMHLRAMAPALFTAFSTSSSAASLPLTIECVEKRAGVSNRICSFTIPLGASLNLSGTALYICMASLFIAQVYGANLSHTTLGAGGAHVAPHFDWHCWNTISRPGFDHYYIGDYWSPSRRDCSALSGGKDPGYVEDNDQCLRKYLLCSVGR